MAMGADYSFELISIETYTPQSNGHDKLFLDSAHLDSQFCINFGVVNPLLCIKFKLCIQVGVADHFAGMLFECLHPITISKSTI